MARRYTLPNLNNYGGPDVTLGTDPMVRRYAPSGAIRKATTLADPNTYDIATQRGLSIKRGAKTRLGQRDLLVDRNGRVIAALNPGGAGATKNQLAFIDNGAGGRKMVVRRGAAPALPGAPNGDNGGGGGGPVDPYQKYRDSGYGFAADYLTGLDTGYNNFNDYVTKTAIPGVSAMTKALGTLSANASSGYKDLVKNYAGSAGNVASAMTTPQVAGATGGVVVAPNQNALAAQQGMAAAAQTGRELFAGQQSVADALGAEKMAGATNAYVTNYASGLLNQYAQKRVDQRLKLDQWISDSQAAADKAQQDYDLKLMGFDQSMINSLIISGDRAAARGLTARGQDMTAQAEKDRAQAIKDAAAIRAQAIRDAAAARKAGKVPKAINGDSMKSTVQKAWNPPTLQAGQIPPPGGNHSTWGGANEDINAKRQALVGFINARRANFPGLTKKNASVVRLWLGSISGLNGDDINEVITQLKQLLP
jgi:hypothetical protein